MHRLENSGWESLESGRSAFWQFLEIVILFWVWDIGFAWEIDEQVCQELRNESWARDLELETIGI